MSHPCVDATDVARPLSFCQIGRLPPPTFSCPCRSEERQDIMCCLTQQGLSVADIAATRNIQETTVLSYLAEAIAAGYPYAWERFEVADSTLAAVRQAASAFAAGQSAAASAEIAAGSTTPCSPAEPPAGPCDTDAASQACHSTASRHTGSIAEAAALNLTTAALSPASAPAPAVLQALGRPCTAKQQGSDGPEDTDSVTSGSVQQCATCRPTSTAAGALLSADAVACIADLVSQRESLRPFREHLPVEISFGVLRLAVAHLLRLSAQHTA